MREEGCVDRDCTDASARNDSSGGGGNRSRSGARTERGCRSRRRSGESGGTAGWRASRGGRRDGGYRSGEVAAHIAIETLREEYYAAPVERAEIATRLQQAFRRANERILREWQPHGEEQLMGTTLVAAVIRGDALVVANVGTHAPI